MTQESEAAQPDPEITAFFEAIGLGEADKIKTMVAANPKLVAGCNDKQLSPIIWALYNRRRELVQVLQDVGAKLGPFEMCALGDKDQLLPLLEADAQLLHNDSSDGFTLLHLACFFGQEEMVALLIEKGADVNRISKGADRLTPLHSAAASGSISAAANLLEAGANPDATQTGGYTALMSAAAQGNQALAHSLLRGGASLDLVAEDGRNAMALAKAAGHKKLVAFLGSR